MTVKILYWLYCDACGGMSSSYTDLASTEKAGARIGWRRYRIGDQQRDVCPTCKRQDLPEFDGVEDPPTFMELDLLNGSAPLIFD